MRSAHFYLLLSSAIFATLGVAASVWGTYLMTIFLHPFDLKGFRKFIADSPEYAMAILEEQRSRTSARAASAAALKNLKTIAKLAEVNPERQRHIVGRSRVAVLGALRCRGSESCLR